jgi:hypothetical protein
MLLAALLPSAPAEARPGAQTHTQPERAGSRCAGITLDGRPTEYAVGHFMGGEPFRPGEELGYDLTVAGVYVGRMEMKVGHARTVEGRRALTLFGRARTNAFTSTFKKFSGRYMTLVDASSLMPFGLRVESTYGDEPRWEKVQFSDDNKKLKATFLYQGREGKRSYDTSDKLMDVLTLLYYARTRDLHAGARECQEVFGARWLWRMDAEVKGQSVVDTPAGKRDAMQVTTRFRRSPHPDIQAPQPKDQQFEVDVYFASDATQVPLQFVIHAFDITALGKLVRWSLKDQGADEDWSF